MDCIACGTPGTRVKDSQDDGAEVKRKRICPCGAVFFSVEGSDASSVRMMTAEEMAALNREADYGGNWPTVRRQIVERDDGMCCTACGGTDDLHVHHVTPLRQFNGNTEAANEPSNLLTLCRGCHADRHREMRHGRTGVAAQ